MPMEQLRGCYGSLEFERVRTYIQSGNVVFDGRGTDNTAMASKIKAGIKKRFGLDVHVIIRTREEMLSIIKNSPFSGLEESKLHVTFLSEKPEDAPWKEIVMVKDKAEKFSVSGREVYLFCPNGYGRSKLSNQFIEKKLGVYATTRNWRTVNALSVLADS